MINYIEAYYEWILKHRSDVCLKVFKVYFELMRMIRDPECEWEYNQSRADHAINFIQNYCKHSKGAMGGKPFILELWELALVSAAFGMVHKIDGTRKYQEVMLIVARKNGKSTLAAAVGLYLMIADGEMGPEIYAVATKKDQAKIIWIEAKRMVRKSPILLKRIKTLIGELSSDYNDSFFRPLGRDSDSIDGLNVQGALLDEIHAWQDLNLYDVIVDGTSSREQPFIFITSTAGTIRESVYDRKYDEGERVLNGFQDELGYKNERFLPIIYELDQRSEWIEPESWVKANPGLGTIKRTDQLKNKVNKAQADPKLVRNLLCKDFNIRETSSQAWLTFEELNNPETFDLSKLNPKYAIGGADLSSTTDLTCATALFMVPGDNTIYALQMYWIPEDLLELRVAEDRIPYDIWRDQGLLRTCPGNKVHHKYVTEWFTELQQDYNIYIPWCGYDSWSAQYWVEEMQSFFGLDCMDPVIQGKKTLSGPMQNMGADLGIKRINYNNNPVLKWCLSNTAIETDKNLNIQPCKTKNQRRRIDGTASLLDAYVCLERHLENYINMI